MGGRHGVRTIFSTASAPRRGDVWRTSKRCAAGQQRRHGGRGYQRPTQVGVEDPVSWRAGGPAAAGRAQWLAGETMSVFYNCLCSWLVVCRAFRVPDLPAQRLPGPAVAAQHLAASPWCCGASGRRAALHGATLFRTPAMDPFQAGMPPLKSGGFIDHYVTRVMYPSGGTGYAQTAAFTAVLVSWFLYARQAAFGDRGRANVGAVVSSPRRNAVIPGNQRWPGGGERSHRSSGEQRGGAKLVRIDGMNVSVLILGRHLRGHPRACSSSTSTPVRVPHGADLPGRRSESNQSTSASR